MFLQEVDILSQDDDDVSADVAAASPSVPTEVLTPAQRTALLRELPEDTAPSARAAVAAAAGADLGALQTAFQVGCCTDKF